MQLLSTAAPPHTQFYAGGGFHFPVVNNSVAKCLVMGSLWLNHAKRPDRG